jgi:NifU-like protein involved in Fe-S cluster formation
MQQWFQQGDGEYLAPPPSDLQALSAVREYPARRRCVLLSWDALSDALDAI